MNDFVKVFGSGDDQVVFILRDVSDPHISMTFKIPGIGISDVKFEYDDTSKGIEDARKAFTKIDEESANKQRDNMIKGFGV